MHQGMPNKYNFRNLASELSAEMFEEHWKLYEEYCKNLNEVLAQLSNPYAQDLLQSVSPIEGKYRELQRSRAFLMNGVLLHELFFENVILPDNTTPMIPGSQFLSMVQTYFPQIKSNDFWEVLIKPAAKSARGWCVLGFNTLTATMEISMLDSDGEIIPVGLYPILVIDVYEHSYSHQYGIDRGTYLEHLRKSINWAVVDHRVAVIYSAHELMRMSIPAEAEDYIKNMSNDADKDFGFPSEESFPDQGKPQGYGIDTRKDESLKANPRAFSAVEDIVTKSDLDVAFQKVRCLSVISFRTEDDLFDEQVKGKGPRFREQLWTMLQEGKE